MITSQLALKSASMDGPRLLSSLSYVSPPCAPTLRLTASCPFGGRGGDAGESGRLGGAGGW